MRKTKIVIAFVIGMMTSVFSGAIAITGNNDREYIIKSDPNTNDAPSLIKTKINELSALGGGIIRLLPGIYNVPNVYRAIEISNKQGFSPLS